MITIIFGKPRAGKTALMTHLLRQEMFNRDRIIKMQKGITKLKEYGLNWRIPKHPVVTSFGYVITGHKQGYRPRVSRQINPFRLGYQEPYTFDRKQPVVQTHNLEPFTVVGITEGQKYFNSRKSGVYPDWQSRWFEQHGHNDYDIYIDVQRPILIDVNIRDLACFIEIISKTNKIKDGVVVGISWVIRRIEGSFELDRYFASGKKDKTTYHEETIKIDYNIHDCYDSQMCKLKFLQGHLNDDYDTQEAEPIEKSKDGIVDHLNKLDDELPAGFYQIKGR